MKKGRRLIIAVLKWVSFSILGLLFVVFLLLSLDRDYKTGVQSAADKKSIQAQKEYSPDVDSTLYRSLLEKYGKNKTLAEGFEIQCLLVLSHYPELKETPIEFLVQPVFFPLYSRPDPKSVLFPWIKRKYLVIISSESVDFFEPILLQNTPFNEQIGIIGHELAHTVYYQEKSALQLAVIAFRYEYDRAFQIDFERKADKIAIAHGLGYQMYDFAFFVRKAFGDSLEEIETEEGDTYLSPKEIALEMGKYDFYKDTLDHPSTYFSK